MDAGVFIEFSLNVASVHMVGSAAPRAWKITPFRNRHPPVPIAMILIIAAILRILSA